MSTTLLRAPITLSNRELSQAINLGELNLHGQLEPLAHQMLAERVRLFKLERMHRMGLVRR